MRADLESGRWAFVSTEQAGRRETRFALAALVVSAILFVVAAPQAGTPLAHHPAFIPIYVTSLVISDLVTAVLLFGEFALLRSTPVLFVATGYLFTATGTVAYALIFPGLFAPNGLLGSGPQTSSAMYMFWHAGFPVAILLYVIGKKVPAMVPRKADGRAAAPSLAIVCAVLSVAVVTIGFTWLATQAHELLPTFLEGHRTTATGYAFLSVVWMMSLCALLALWRSKPYAVLDVWLMVVMGVWLFDIALGAILNTGRYDLGWYAGRIYGMLAASTLLIVLLIEDIRRHARLVQLSVEFQAANAELAALSRKDGLTGIANRRLFDTYLNDQIAVARRHARPLALVLCDVDHFKAFNDAHGHLAGDACLKAVALHLKKCCQRPADLAARYGGEEFAMILPETDRVGALHIAEAARDRICQSVQALPSLSGPRSVTVSCGVATLMSAMTAQELIQAADSALYSAKIQGRDRVVCLQEVRAEAAVRPGSSGAANISYEGA